MKKLFNFCLLTAGAALLSGAAVQGNAKSNAAAKQPPKSASKAAVKAAPAVKAPAPAKAAPAAKIPAVPQKPVVPEKKQPFELWMIAQDKAFECIQKKQYDEAFKYFDQAEKEANKGVWKNYTLYEKARLLVQLNRQSEAIELLRKKLSRDRETVYHKARTALMRGEILADVQRYDEAEAEFRTALSYDQNNWIPADATLGLGRIAEAKENFQEAEKYYTSVLKDTARLPGIRAKGLIAQVKMLEKRKQYAQAAAFLDGNCNIEQLPAERATELEFLRSDLKIALKDLKGARFALDVAARIQGKPAPWTAAVFTRIAKLFVIQKNYREAQNFMRRAKSVRGHDWGYEKEFHAQVDKEVARQNRERILRERKARMEREKRLRLERQRKAKIEQQRKAKLERERKARLEQQKKAKKGEK